MAKEQVKARYKARVENPDHDVYDGDTIDNVYLMVHEMPTDVEQAVEIFPDVFLTPRGVEIKTNVRVFGIDTPERHPAHAGRTLESLQRERAHAMQARQELLNLLAKNDYEFEVRNPSLGKYAGRTVMEVYIGGLDYAAHMIDGRFALAYTGGTKQAWDAVFDEWDAQFSPPNTSGR